MIPPQGSKVGDYQPASDAPPISHDSHVLANMAGEGPLNCADAGCDGTVIAEMARIVNTRPLEAITIGDRYRKELGDLTSLAESIAEIGLLHPIVVTPDSRLIAGVRRLAACRLLSWTEVPVHVVDLAEIVRGEYDENTVRKDFQLTEAVAIAAAVRPIEEAAARERQRIAGKEGGRGHKGSGKLPQAKGRARDHVARRTGVSGRTLEKAEEVVAAAEAEPEKYGDLPEEMDDLDVAKHGRRIWIEVKTKAGPTFHRITQCWEHGIPWRHFLHYQRVAAETGCPVWLAVREEESGETLVASLAILAGRVRENESATMGHMAFFPREAFKRLA